LLEGDRGVRIDSFDHSRTQAIQQSTTTTTTAAAAAEAYKKFKKKKGN